MTNQNSSQGGIVIAGGGTGGHIYPAISIAQIVRKKYPSLAIDFVGTRRGLEGKIVPRENFPLHFIDVGALNGVGLAAKILTLFSLPMAVFQAMGLLHKLKPKVVIGVGGYASGPVMLAAVMLKPFLKMQRAVFEPNAYPGLTNRWLARWVDIAFTNFEVTQKFFSLPEVVGIPIRDGLEAAARTQHGSLRVLVFGGSQGARGINTVVLDALKKGGPWLEGLEIVHQIGSRDFKAVDEEYQKLEAQGMIKRSQVSWFEFLYDMPERYKWADLVLCRAGASTLAELAACQKASILVPFPFAADNHQQENAEALASKAGALMVLQKDFTAEKLISLLSDFKLHPEKLKTLEEAIARFYIPRSAERIVDHTLGKA